MNLYLKTSTVNQPGLFDVTVLPAARRGALKKLRKNSSVQKPGKFSAAKTKARKSAPKAQVKVQVKVPVKAQPKQKAQPAHREKIIDITAPPANTMAFRLWEKVKGFGKLVQKAIVLDEGKVVNLIDDRAVALAWQGIQRHLRACERAKVKPDSYAILEIITDARSNKAQWCNIR